GKIIFTTLGPRAWYRPRTNKDSPSPYSNDPELPIATPALDAIAQELRPGTEEDPVVVESFRPLLSAEIGYSVVARGTVLPVFIGFLLMAVLLGIGLKRLGRLDLLGWMVPAATLGVTAAFLILGEWSRGAARPTVAVVQLVDADTGTGEAAVHGLLAAYRPD